MGTSQSLSLSYIGAIGRDLLRATSFFFSPSVNPNFQSFSLTDNTATSDYHALQLKFQRRLSRGLQALASYSLSHSIDISSSDSSAGNVNSPGTVASPTLDRGNSDFDIRHSFTAGVTYDLPYRGSDKVPACGRLVAGQLCLARSAPPVGLVGAMSFAAGTIFYLRPSLNPGFR